MRRTRRKPSRRHLKTHRSYTVEEAARCLLVAKGTVRRWIKTGLPALADRKPILILGHDLIEFLSRSKAKIRCQPHECYCVKCRAPRAPAADLAEYVPILPSSGNLRAICPVCHKLMHKRIAFGGLAQLRTILDVTIAQAPNDIVESPETSLNEHFRKAS
jgi:excisionase family DNA binding protein